MFTYLISREGCPRLETTSGRVRPWVLRPPRSASCSFSGTRTKPRRKRRIVWYCVVYDGISCYDISYHIILYNINLCHSILRYSGPVARLRSSRGSRADARCGVPLRAARRGVPQRATMRAGGRELATCCGFVCQR